MRIPVLFLFFLLLAALGFPSTGITAELNVPGQYSTIQDAINAAQNGDRVLVDPGTYTENIDFLGKAITVISVEGPTLTIIDGGRISSVVAFVTNEGNGSIIDGFTITNGTGYPQTGHGGSISYHGGGVISENTDPIIRNNIITLNFCDYGGGVSATADSNAIIENNLVIENTAAGGGGIWTAGDVAYVLGNTICFNTGDRGGALYTHAGSPVIANNLIYRNEAFESGGAFRFFNKCYPVITNNTIVENHCWDEAGGMHVILDSEPVVTNTIFWNNTASCLADEIFVDNYMGPASLTISYSDVKGGQAGVLVGSGSVLNWGPGMIDADPQFAEPGVDDYHLAWGSPCRNAGDNSASGIPATDFEGDPRIALTTVDMGGDEFFYHLCHFGSVVPGSPLNIKIIGGVGMRVFLGLGSGIQDPPSPTPYGDLYLLGPITRFNLGIIPGSGILTLNAPAPASWVPGDKHPIQSLIGNTLSNLDILIVE